MFILYFGLFVFRLFLGRAVLHLLALKVRTTLSIPTSSISNITHQWYFINLTKDEYINTSKSSPIVYLRVPPFSNLYPDWFIVNLLPHFVAEKYNRPTILHEFQVYNTVIWHFYTLWNDHHKSSCHLLPYSYCSIVEYLPYAVVYGLHLCDLFINWVLAPLKPLLMWYILGLEKCIMVCIHHYNITQYFHCFKILCISLCLYLY